MNSNNLINLDNCQHISNHDYDENYENIETSNYTWYYDKFNIDKIGINPDGNQLMHDSMLFTLKKFRSINKSINGINTTQLIMKLDVRNGEGGQTNKYFTDNIFGEKSAYIIFKYVEINKKLTFSHIVFNGKVFK